MAVQKFYVDVDLSQNQLLNAKVENKTAAEIAGTSFTASDAGSVFINTDEGTLSVYNGTAVYETADKAQLVSEIARAQTAEGVLQANLDAEAAARAAAVAQEAADRAAAVSAAQAAAEAHADTAVSNLIGAAPAALDTLNEIAAALGDDANFAATITTQVAGVQTNLDTVEASLNGRLTAVEARENIRANQNPNVNLVANTPYTYQHNLNLTNKDTVQCNFTINGQMVMFECVHVDADSIQVTSSVDVSGVTMTAIGW